MIKVTNNRIIMKERGGVEEWMKRDKTGKRSYNVDDYKISMLILSCFF